MKTINTYENVVEIDVSLITGRTGWKVKLYGHFKYYFDTLFL